MKKLIIFIFSLFFTSILITNAAPCKVISGDGTNIGDEIQCGTENFYVLSNDGKNIEMLAKYNLYVGRTYYKVEMDQTFETWSEINNYWNENYASEYEGYERFIVNDSNEYYGALAYKTIETEEIKQSVEAIGAHGDLKVEPLFPEIGVYNIERGFYGFYGNYLSEGGEVYSDGYIDIDINLSSEKDADLLEYFKSYSEYLSNIGISVNNMTILAVSDIDNLVNEITGNRLPLQEWWNNQSNWGLISNGINGDFYVVGSIKDFMPEGYEWLWSTTYWTRTIPEGRYLDNLDFEMFFVDTNGDLCDGDYCEVSVGAGIRPVVTIPAYLIYNIETKTDGNGTVEADHIEAEGGTVVKFTIKPKEGYVLGEVKVTDANGNVVTFTDYTFIMPNANVLIEATFIKEESNPNTKDIIIITISLLIFSGIILTFVNHKRSNIV